MRIDGPALAVSAGLAGDADLTISSRGEDWVAVLAGDLHPLWAVVTGKLKLKGNRKLLTAFKRCFPL